MARTLTTVEVENKVAFLVQLNATLAQVKAVVSSPSLSAANKTKCSPLKEATESWIEVVGSFGTARPSLAAPPAPNGTQEGEGHKEDERAKETPDTQAAVPSTGPSHSAATVTHELVDGRSLLDLVNYLQLLLRDDLPERSKLIVFGRGLVRLLVVRCCSTIMASLQHVLHHTYVSESESDGEEGDARNRTSSQQLFISLSREIRISNASLLRCVQLIVQSADPSDLPSARFAAQLCVDVVKQLRRAMAFVQSRMEKEELHLLRRALLHSGFPSRSDRATSVSMEDVDAAQDAMQRESPEKLEAHVRHRVAALQSMWGVALVRSVHEVGNVVSIAIKFLAKVAAVREEGSAPDIVALKKGAGADMYALCPLPSSASTAAMRPASSATDLAAAAEEGHGSDGVVASPASASSATPAKWRRAAACVLERIGCSFLATYLVGIAACSGDGDEGSLVATRLFADVMQYLATEDIELLRCVVTNTEWSRGLHAGMLNCLISMRPAVLSTGLDALAHVTAASVPQLGPEVGYLYSVVVLRLLESPNSPHYVKQAILLHLVGTLLAPSPRPTPAADGGAAAAPTTAVPLLMHMYRAYDLNVHAHQLNVAQQLTGVLSRIVRAAPKADFAQDAAVQEQLLAQGRPKEEGEGGGAAPMTSVQLASLSMPSVALYGLVRIVEMLTGLAPVDDDDGTDLLLRVPKLECREEKLQAQRSVDVFNASPKKFIEKEFQVTAEDNTVPASHEKFTKEWDHAFMPPVEGEARAAKISAVVDFLTSSSSLSPEAVSEYLTTPALFPLQVCAEYLRRLPLTGCTFLGALQELLMSLQLPKEGQRIERLLEYFSWAYFQANQGPGVDNEVFPFKSDNACFITVVASVMLNTNVHNPSAGMHLDLKTFRGQLRGCNEGDSFSDGFVDDIFNQISTKPLESVKTVAVGNNTAVDSSRGAFDLFFVSVEEKKQIAFGLERQRIANDARQLLQLRTGRAALEGGAVLHLWWCGAARDFYLATWSSVCAVFGPAMCEGGATPRSILVLCIRGLQSLMCTAAVFRLLTECEVTLLTLLQMSEYEAVSDACRQAVLVVAASPYGTNFPERCWLAVFQIIMNEKHEHPDSAATHPFVEDIFNRVEHLTRRSLEADEAEHALPSGQAEALRGAVRSILRGCVANLYRCDAQDMQGLTEALALLRRSLEFTSITHTRRETSVVYVVNVRDLHAVVLPLYIHMIRQHKASDEALQLLLKTLTEVLCTMWGSYTTTRFAVMAKGEEADAGKPLVVTRDNAPASFVACFACFRELYQSADESDSAAESATLLQMHVLQSVKELLSRTIHSAAQQHGAASPLSLSTMVAAWQETLFPVAMALCDCGTSSAEAGSLAQLVLSRLATLACGSEVELLPGKQRGALLVLLAHVAYAGGMCSDANVAQVCVAQLSSICTAALAIPPPSSSPTDTPGSPLLPLAEGLLPAHHKEEDAAADALRHFSERLESDPHCAAIDTLERLCLLLRSEREHTRREVVSQLRTLALQLQPAQVFPLALHVSELVLEGVLGHASQHHKTTITHPSLMSFLMLRMPVPAKLRRCSRSSFRGTLPEVLHFLSGEVLTAVFGRELERVAHLIMQHCLLPILLALPNGQPARLLVVRAFSQCISTCLSRGVRALSPEAAQQIVDGIVMALFALRKDMDSILPAALPFPGRGWASAVDDGHSKEWTLYRGAASMTVRVARSADTGWFTAGLRAGEAAEVGRAPRPSKEDSSPHRAGLLYNDEDLADYIACVGQLVSGVPKDLVGLVRLASSAPSPPRTQHQEWAVPHGGVSVLLTLLLEAAGICLAIFARVNHPHEVEAYASQMLERGRAAPPIVRHNGLLPHAAIRGVLQAYLELAVQREDVTVDAVMAVVMGVAEVTHQLQGGTPDASIAADPAVLQRLPPQEQQHVRTCSAGMQQQLASVLAHFTSMVISSPSTPSSLSPARRASLETAALQPSFFSCLVSLLTPTAGGLIITARDYFAWYIAKQKLTNGESGGGGGGSDSHRQRSATQSDHASAAV